MTATRTPSQTSSPDNQHTTASRDAALKGASTAFARPPAKGRAPSNTYAGANGALAAATVAGTRMKTPSPNRTINSDGFAADISQNNKPPRPANQEWQSSNLSVSPQGIPNMSVSPASQREHSRSPSHFAAALVAARSSQAAKASSGASVTQRLPVQQSRRTPHTTTPRQVPKSVADQEKPKPTVPVKKASLSQQPTESNDISSIPPTNSLVALFERQLIRAGKSSKQPAPILIKSSEHVAIKSPRPIRTSSGVTSMFEMDLASLPVQQPPRGASDVSSKLTSEESLDSSSDAYASASEAPISPLTIRKLSVPALPRSSSTRKPASSPDHTQALSRLNRQRQDTLVSIQQQPLLRRDISSPLESFPSSQSISAAFHQMHPRRVTPLKTGDSLANAIVASSLASSRAPSPTKLPNPTLTRHGKSHTFNFARTPSPAKAGMRHTLRSAPSLSEGDFETLHPHGKHNKKWLARKHPHKHHEGDRKRWRDAVTERERRRYEGVWAANKNMHVSFTPDEIKNFQRAPQPKLALYSKEAAAESVSNIVARDIWTRSRLPSHVLEDVWDLVDTHEVGRLSKDEFVVGMWLIDQCLKGRKLPVKVHDSVWASVKMVQGIKIRRK